MRASDRLVTSRCTCRAALFAGLTALLLASWPASAGPDKSPPASATLDLKQTQIAFLVSGHAGSGTLHYRGRDYPFTIRGLGVGGIGISVLDATGIVYSLDRIAQFSGAYSQLRTGFALGDVGRGKLWLKNGNGVIVKLVARRQGVALTLGADAIVISLK